MKSLLLIFIAMAVSTPQITQSSASSGPKETRYTLEVVSASVPGEKVEFKGSYVAFTPTSQPEMKFVKEFTPFKIEVIGSNCLAMIQALSTDQRVRVTLTKYTDGILNGHATGTSNLNFVHGEPEGIGYGVPTWDPSVAGQFNLSK